MKTLKKITRALPVIGILVAMFILSIPSMASATTFYSFTNTTHQYVDLTNPGVMADVDWFTLGILPSGYNASAVTSITLSMTGDSFVSGDNINVYLRFGGTGSSYILIDSFVPTTFTGPNGTFSKSWTLPPSPDYTDFASGMYLYMGYGCHFYTDASSIDIEIKSVPEPATMLLLGLGLMGLAGVRRKIQK